MLFFGWLGGKKDIEWSCRQGSLGLVEPWCKGSVELAYTRVIVASFFRLFAVFLPSFCRVYIEMV